MMRWIFGGGVSLDLLVGRLIGFYLVTDDIGRF